MGARSDCGIGQASRQVAPFVAPFLDELFQTYNLRDYLDSDPLSVAHRYNDPRDQEVVALVAALFSYGNAAQIIKALGAILAPFGVTPYEGILNYKGQALWSGFKYRFHKEPHLQVLFLSLAELLKTWGTVEGIFLSPSSIEANGGGDNATYRGINRAVVRFREQFAKHSSSYFGHKPSAMAGGMERGLKFLINTPAEGSACKRILMFLRWMVRKDDLDLGLWSGLKPSELFIPLDTHVARISYYIGLRQSPLMRAPQWAMVEEVTTSLRMCAPQDPVRYDFAISRLGILNLCKKTFVKSICTQCVLQTACRYSAHRVLIEDI